MLNKCLETFEPEKEVNCILGANNICLYSNFEILIKKTGLCSFLNRYVRILIVLELYSVLVQRTHKTLNGHKVKMACSEPSGKTPATSDDDFVFLEKPFNKHIEPNIQKLLTLIITKLPEIARHAQDELNEVLQDITNSTDSYRSENSQLKSNIEQLRKERKQLRSENEQQRSDIRQLRSENGQLNSKNKELVKQTRETESSYQDKLKVLQQTITQQKKQIDEERRKNAKLSTRDDIDETFKRKLESNDTIELMLKQTQDKLRDTEAELDATKTRLSKSMGDKLTDNNPNIADLSDNNRPTKLAEKFQELYDNQWTDAFENVYSKCKVKESENTETITTSMLIKILMETKTFCEKEACHQTKAMQGAITAQRVSTDRDIHTPPEVNKQIKDCQRIVAIFSGKQIFQKYQDELTRSESSTARMAKNVPNFVKECFNICWLMTVQDPPLVFGPNISKGERFETDMYKAYIKSGRKIDFVVWPALLLHKNGPVLTKGVAQGLVEERHEHSGSTHGRSKHHSTK